MCSGIHRNLPQVSRVKSLWLDFWENDLIEVQKEKESFSFFLHITCDSEFVSSSVDRGTKLYRAKLTAWVTSGIFL